MTTNWVIYPLKKIKQNKLAKHFNKDVLATLEKMGDDSPDVLGVLVEENDTLIMLNTFVSAENFIASSDKAAIKPMRELMGNKMDCLVFPLDDLDIQLMDKFSKQNPFIQVDENEGPYGEKEQLYRVIWSMRINGDVIINKSIFVNHGNNVKVDMFETGDHVLIWLAKSQQIYGVVAKFGILDDEVIIKVVVTKNNTISYNGDSVALEVGDSISAPIKSIEKYDPTKAA